ncbi:MAG: hypothetical protein QXM27_02820 [Candidatus Pacearchaeota archaeon]
MKYVVIMTLGDWCNLYISKIGNEKEIVSYLKELEEQDRLNEVYAIFPLEEGAGDIIYDFLELDNETGEPIAVRE